MEKTRTSQSSTLIEKDRGRASQLLRSQKEKAQKLLKQMHLSDQDFEQWELTTRGFIEKAFGDQHYNINKFDSACPKEYALWVGFPGISPEETPEQTSARNKNFLKEKLIILDSCIEQIYMSSTERENLIVSQSSHISLKKVFIVHGSDTGKKAEVARLISKLDIEPIILHEQPNEGKTLIEKFEKHASEVGFALVNLTADDIGCSSEAFNNSKDKRAEPKWERRARQNVVFELGFFFGSIGRDRVCVLYSPEVELPSDIHGLTYIRFDTEGAWELHVAKALKAAGFEVDLNKLSD